MPARPTSKALVMLAADAERTDEARRQLLADWCRLVGRRLNGDAGENVAKTDVAPPVRVSLRDQVDELNLPPRMRQVLTGLLAGASEKELARTLSLSPHTIHAHVKQLHKRLNVSSRGELLARFVGPTA